MKLTGYLIEKYNRMTGAYTCHRLVDEAAAMNVDLRIVGVHDCCAASAGQVFNAGSPLAPRDFVINRYKYGKLKDRLNELAPRAYNPLDPFKVYVNKYEQVKALRSAGFRVPRYLMATASLPFREVAARLCAPFVAKGLESSMGQEIFLIADEADYASFSCLYPADKEWLFEEFIASSYGRDLRLFCIRGRAVACMMRQSAQDFRANVALGATVTAVPIDDTLRLIARDIYEQTQLDFVGIDLLFGPDGAYYFCEINITPGLEGIEQATGVNVAKEIITLIKDDYCHE